MASTSATITRSSASPATPTTRTIKKAYRRLAMKYHPDRNVGDAEAEDEVQGGRRGLRGAPRPAEAAALRPLRPRRAGRDGRPRLPRRRVGLRHVRRPVRRLLRRRAAGGGPRGGRDLQTTLEIDLVEAVPRHEEVDHDPPRGDAARSARQRREARHASRPPAGAATATASSSSAGLLPHPADLPGLRRPRRGHHRPVPDLPRRGPGRRPPDDWKSTIPPGVDTGMRVRLNGEGEAGEPGGRAATCTSSSGSASTRSSPRRTEPDLPGAGHVQPGGPGRDDRGADARRPA